LHGLALEELDHAVGDRPAFEALVAHLHIQRHGATLIADLCDELVLRSEVIEHLGLVERDTHRLFDVEVECVFQAPHPQREHYIRAADCVDAIGL